MVFLPKTSKLPSGVADIFLYLIGNILLLPGIFDIIPIITVSWSLSYEAFYYIITPMMVLLFSMASWTPSKRASLLVLIYISMLVLESRGVPLHFRLSMFLGGAFLYEFSFHLTGEMKTHKENILFDTVTLVLLIFALILFTFLGNSRGLISGNMFDIIPSFSRFVILNVAFVALVFRCLFSNGILDSAFSWTPLRWLGNISYSYYLFHGLGFHIFFTVLSKLWINPFSDPINYFGAVPDNAD
jgi:exopolysaccharide production protein ExoZ